MKERASMPDLVKPWRLAPAWRTLFTIILIAAFALQSYFTQTHLHLAAAQPAAGAFETALVSLRTNPNTPSQHGGLPVDEDAAHCPICQAMAAAGSFVLPAIPVHMLLPLVSHHVPVPRLTPALFSPVVHHWRGRAPPTL